MKTTNFIKMTTRAIIKCKTFNATVTVGLFKGYSQELLPLDVVKKVITNSQIKVRDQFDVILSAKITPCEIICLGQDEPSLAIAFMQYPKFQYHENLLKEAIIFFTKNLQQELEQNRVVVVFDDETLMLENSKEIDPNINI
jgi:hypothetical protein